ncbi:hypothetical protein LOD99_5097 [Oopsacas minuta]|uniref:Elongation of very long chain fatty acids protein n=1 Tax=Oopsacas minuta TaxID=111878 RepID=A0AAV7JSL8_9METZ|nr:hypothetical protein LOD99_5097 [Oopsacas minuta]
MAGVEMMPGSEWLPKDRYLNTSSIGRLFSEMEMITLDPFEMYRVALELEDPRTKDWFLMSSPFPTFFLVALYMLIILLGPTLMKNRKEWDLQFVLFFYNFAMVGLSTYIATEAFFGAQEVEYSWLCQPMIYSTHPGHMRVANALWWYYFSKCIEFLDTIFFILRKKNNQITFLHIYHHATMFAIWWMGIAWVAATLGAILNSIVHIVMYTYYGLSSFKGLRPFLWWKRYLTELQLAQFGSGVVLGAYTIGTNCNFPMWMQFTFVTYAITFLILFGNFYYQTYIKRRRPVKKVETNGQMANKNGKVVSEIEITE